MINAIDIIAVREGKKPEEIREAIQEALELNWASSDSNHVQARKKLTDSPTATNPEDFIAAVVKEVQKRLDLVTQP
jgi:hypothetical protein